MQIKIESSRYGDYIEIDEYNGRVSLIMSNEGKDGKVYKNWAFPQKWENSQSVPAKKAIPIKVLLGNNRKEAIENLNKVIDYLQGVDSGNVPF